MAKKQQPTAGETLVSLALMGGLNYIVSQSAGASIAAFMRGTPHPVSIHTASGVIFVILSIFEFAIWRLFLPGWIKINDKLFYCGAWNSGSEANFAQQSEGHLWTPSSIVKNKMKKKDLFIDQFRFSTRVKNRLSIYGLRALYENFRCSVNAIDLTRGSLIIGQMGGGKTEFYYSLLEQDRFARALIYDNKGAFTARFYDSKRDFILNPFDERGKLWNPFEEAVTNDFAARIFTENLMRAVMPGDSDPFFTEGAKNTYFDMFNLVNFSTETRDMSPGKKLHWYVGFLQEFFDKVEKLEKASIKDVAETMKRTYEFFEMLDYQINVLKRETFTIHHFFNEKNSKIFMLDLDEHKALKPYFIAFYAVFSATMLSRPENKDPQNLTAILIDEYLTFSKKMDRDFLNDIHTKIRGFGGCLLPAVQFLPKKDDELVQLLTSSAAHWFLFEGIDDDTIKKIQDTINKVTHKRSPDTEYEDGNPQTTESTLVPSDIFHSLAQKYEHITFIPSKRLLYRGYTPQVKFEKVGENYKPLRVLDDFYTWKVNGKRIKHL